MLHAYRLMSLILTNSAHNLTFICLVRWVFLSNTSVARVAVLSSQCSSTVGRLMTFPDLFITMTIFMSTVSMLLARPSRDAETFARMFGSHANSRILDYGGGAGVFAAKLRTLGFSAVETSRPLYRPGAP